LLLLLLLPLVRRIRRVGRGRVAALLLRQPVVGRGRWRARRRLIDGIAVISPVATTNTADRGRLDVFALPDLLLLLLR
jgi:hypothetical protein